MKKYDIKYRMSETAQAKVDALFAALKAAEKEDIELIEVQPWARVTKLVRTQGSN